MSNEVKALRCPHCKTGFHNPPTIHEWASICNTCRGRGYLSLNGIARSLMIDRVTVKRVLNMGATRQSTAIHILKRLEELRWI